MISVKLIDRMLGDFASQIVEDKRVGKIEMNWILSELLR